MRQFLAVCLMTSLFCCSVSQAQNSDAALRKQVLDAISAAQNAILERQLPGGRWELILGRYEVGTTGLATLALLTSGIEKDHDAIQRATHYLIDSANRGEIKQTYDTAMAIMALAASGRNDVKGTIARLAQQLEDEQRKGPDGGNWAYGGGVGGPDNSNTQFAVLGLREAAHVGIPIDREVWRRAQDHFVRTQVGNVKASTGAGWGYKESDQPTGSMTVAGLASLVICRSMLQDDSDVTPDGRIMCCGEQDQEVEQAIQAGERWLASHFSFTSNPGSGNWYLYYLYGLERAGRFTGRRFFGDHDWYREGASLLVKGQNPIEGIWVSQNQVEQNPTVGTSLGLLFISKGLSPVLINKIKYGNEEPDTLTAEWNLHPRDVTNLTEYIMTQDKWPKLLTWQTLDLTQAAENPKEGLAAMLQSPVQYLSGDGDLSSIQGRELELLREYIAQGGFLFVVQNCGSATFDESFRDLIQRLFQGQYTLEKLPSTHDVYRSEHIFPTDPPELWGVDYGCRTAIIYAPFDYACRWEKWTVLDLPQRHQQVRLQIDKAMKVGINVIAYATGRELWDKLEPPEVLANEDNRLDRGRLTIARLKHTGGWDTAPRALQRLQMGLQKVGIPTASAVPTVPANDPTLFDYPMIYMHGRKNFLLSEEERDQLLAYLSNGGFLFADACCGSSQFDESFRKLIEQLFGQPLERIPTTHELHNLRVGYDIREVTRRLPVENGSSLLKQQSKGEAILEGIQVNGRYVVVYSKYDLSCALERQATPACAGYTSDDAVKIGVNLVLYGLFR